MSTEVQLYEHETKPKTSLDAFLRRKILYAKMKMLIYIWNVKMLMKMDIVNHIMHVQVKQTKRKLLYSL